MAVLSKNGVEIGRIVTAYKVFSYRSNGMVLVNSGFGWKLASTKRVDNIHELYRRDLEAFQGQLPAMLDLVKLLQDVPARNRAVVFKAIETSYTDPDGLWSDLTEMLMPEVTFDDVKEWCETYQQYILQRESSCWGIMDDKGEIAYVVKGSREFRRQKAKSVGLSKLHRMSDREVDQWLSKGQIINYESDLSAPPVG